MKHIGCTVFGHRIVEPTHGVEACERCNDARMYYDIENPFSRFDYLGIVGTLLLYARNAWFWTASKCLPWRRCAYCSKLFFRPTAAGCCVCCHAHCSPDCCQSDVPF